MTEFGKTWVAFRVPLPPEPRLYRAVFSEVCEPGDHLYVFPRRTRLTFGLDTTVITEPCPRRD